jgi:Transcriptional regulators
MKPEHLNFIDTLTSIRKLRERIMSNISLELTDLSSRDFIALSKICRNENRMMMSQLSEITGMSNAHITAAVDSLERKGLVKRTRGEDRRSYNIELTESGRKRCQEIETIRMKSIDSFFEKMNEKDSMEFQEALTKLNDLLRKYL